MTADNLQNSKNEQGIGKRDNSVSITTEHSVKRIKGVAQNEAATMPM